MSTDAFQPVIIGWLLGTTALGYVSWAYSLILMPILILDAVDRVVVPTLAKAHDSPATLARWTERAMRVNCLLAFPVAALLLTSIPQIILVVFTAKWLPASDLVRQFVPAILAVALFTPILQAFNAVGRTGVALRLSMIWAAVTWSVGTFLVARWGLQGYGWFYVALQITYLPIAIMGVRTLRLSLWRVARGPCAGFVAAAGTASIVPAAQGWSGLLVRIAIVGSAFLLGALAIGWREIFSDVRTARRSLSTSGAQSPPIDAALQQP
jgi:O-antigen/teichoic acid export membrane protein